MTKHLTKLLALAIGAFMILDALPSSVSILIRTTQESNGAPLVVVLGLFPVVIACLFAFLFYRYASTMEIPAENTDESILYAGVKLSGLYLCIQGISRLFIGIGFLFRSEASFDSAFLYISYAAIYFALSFVLIYRTTWLLKYLGTQDDA